MKNLLLPALILLSVNISGQTSPLDVYEMFGKGYEIAPFDSIKLIQSIQPGNPVIHKAAYQVDSGLYVLSGARQTSGNNSIYHSSRGPGEFRIAEFSLTKSDTIRRYYFFKNAAGYDTLVRDQGLRNNVVGYSIDYQYFYNTQNQIDSICEVHYLPNQFIDTMAYEYHYSAGKLDSINSVNLLDTNLKRNQTYHYDSSGRLSYLDLYVSNGGPSEYFRRDSMIYNPSGKIRAIRNYYFIPPTSTYQLFQEVKFKKSQWISTSEPPSIQFSVYPNPVKDKLKIKGAAIQRAEILTVTGSLISTLTFHDRTADVSHLAPGYYVLRVYWGEAEEPQTLLLIKE